MGGGDLNNKKSWGVHTQASQIKVWEAEQAAIKERKRADVLRKEREEERAVEELRRIAAENGTSSSLIDPKIAWMYQDGKGADGVDEAAEAYLLGKRRVDNLVLKQDKEKTEAKKDEDPLGAVLNARDITSKAALDPMFAIEQSRQKALQSMMADPFMRRKMMKEITKSKDSKDKDGEKRRKHRHRDDDRERHHRSKRRRYSDDDKDDRRERRHRRYSDDVEDDRRERRHRHHSSSRQRSPSRSPYRGRPGERGNRDTDSPHSLSPDARRDDSRYSGRRRERGHSRSRSPHHANREDKYSRYERSPYSRDRHPRRDRDDHRLNKREHNRESKTFPSPPDSQKESDVEAERAAKLAAMSANANDLEEARQRRLAEMEARDFEAKQREDMRREKRGDRFVDGLREKATSKGLGDRLKHAGGSRSRLDDSF